jgi:hypothetical protein
MPRKPKRDAARPASDTQLIRDAVADLTADEEKYAKRARREGKRRARVRWWQYLDRRILIAAGVILVILIGDGVRRENREFAARLIGFTGQVSLVDSKGAAIGLEQGARLTAGATVRTGPDAKATLQLEDGSRIVVTSDSELTVRGLDYNRGAQYRDHAFLVSRGQAMAAVGSRFGADSELTVGTPGAVAAVRGTTFLVRYDPLQEQTYAATRQGEVQLTGNGLQWQPVPPGKYCGVDAAGAVYPAQPLPEATAQEFLAAGELNLPESTDPFMRRVEFGLNRALDPVLSILGIGRASWGILAGNRARLEAARLAARDLYTVLEGTTEAPARVNLLTLEELGLSATRRDLMLKQLAGYRLEGYVSDGRDYVLTVRAKDRAKSRFLVTRKGVQNVTGNPAAVEAARSRIGAPAAPSATGG